MNAVADYLARLGVAAGPPSRDLLFALHRAQVSRITYENLAIVLGRPPGIDPHHSLERLSAGGGGYCYHLNGAFSQLLITLGFTVRRHVGGVRDSVAEDVAAVLTNHLTLTGEVDGVTYLVDAGMGDLLYEPVPLVPGVYQQGPFRYELLRLDGGWWRLAHDPVQKSFCDMTFRLEPAEMADLEQRHVWLSTAPESEFVGVLVAERRFADRVEGLRGLRRFRDDAGGRHGGVIDDQDAWFAMLHNDFGLTVAEADRARLWAWLLERHAAWLARQPATG